MGNGKIGWQRFNRRCHTARESYSSATSKQNCHPTEVGRHVSFQFDWSREVVLLGGVTVIVKVAHVRLCHSRMLFVRAYPRACGRAPGRNAS
jgi:hypothetical protein